MELPLCSLAGILCVDLVNKFHPRRYVSRIKVFVETRTVEARRPLWWAFLDDPTNPVRHFDTRPARYVTSAVYYREVNTNHCIWRETLLNAGTKLTKV